MDNKVVEVDFSSQHDTEGFIELTKEQLDLSLPVIIIGKDNEGEPIIGCNYHIKDESQRALCLYHLAQAKWAMQQSFIIEEES